MCILQGHLESDQNTSQFSSPLELHYCQCVLILVLEYMTIKGNQHTG